MPPRRAVGDVPVAVDDIKPDGPTTRRQQAHDPAAAEPRARARGGAAAAAGAAAAKPEVAGAIAIAGAEPAEEGAAPMEEVSEERSGDQPVVEDDATTAPVPERVRALRRPGEGEESASIASRHPRLFVFLT